MRTTTPSLAAGSLLVALALSACGGDDFTSMSADEIVKASVADMDSLETVQVNADVETGGQNTTLDLQLSTAGDCEGTVGVGEGTADVVVVDDKGYFRPDEAFFGQILPDAEQVAAVLDAVGDEYITDDQGQFSSFCDLDELLSEINDPTGEEKVTKGEESEVDGEDAIIIEGETKDGQPTKAYIATGDKHYILKLEVTGDEPGEVVFSNFDEEFEVTAPGSDEIADLGSLG